jgi:hypothetical protein
MYMRLVFQAMHIDVEFYDKYYPPGSYSDMHLNHFCMFHPELEDPFAHKVEKKRVRASQSKKEMRVKV